MLCETHHLCLQCYAAQHSCVISMFKFTFINWSTLVWSGEWVLGKLHCMLAFRAGWCYNPWFFRRTGKDRVVTSWSLTLSPAKEASLKINKELQGAEESCLTLFPVKFTIQLKWEAICCWFKSLYQTVNMQLRYVFEKQSRIMWYNVTNWVAAFIFECQIWMPEQLEQLYACRC